MRVRVLVVVALLLGLSRFAGAQDQTGKVGIGAFASAVKMVLGQTDRSTVDQWAGVSLRYGFTPALSLQARAGYGWVYARDPRGSHFAAKGPWKTLLVPFSVEGQYAFLADQPFRPFVSFGLGVTDWDVRKVTGGGGIFATGRSVNGDVPSATLVGGIGLELFASENQAFQVALRWNHLIKGNESTIGGSPPDDNRAVLELLFGATVFFGGHKDTDGDGIEDRYDLAPTEPEDFDGFEDSDGVPDPDNDQDGIVDLKDKAPNEPEDKDGYQDLDGVPDPDNDGDGILDVKDKCPDLAEDFDGYQDEDGCPDLDNDGDGIQDKDDKCPNEPETFNGYQDEDGCPDEKPAPKPLEKKGEKLVLPGIHFRVGSARITEDSYPVLDQVYEILRDHPDIVVEIRGHTDNTGSYDFNMRLSQKRAEAVRRYLISRGISPSRLRAVGYGPTQPIATNDTPEGRAANRRIEFVRVK